MQLQVSFVLTRRVAARRGPVVGFPRLAEPCARRSILDGGDRLCGERLQPHTDDCNIFDSRLIDRGDSDALAILLDQ
jgi:hypothetical protein